MEIISLVVMFTVAWMIIFELWGRMFGDKARMKKKNLKLFAEGNEWGYKKVDGHYVHGDEPLICPLSATEFYRWEWSEFKKVQDWKYNHPDWPLTELLNTDDGMMRLVCPPCFENRQNEIQAQNTRIWNREQAEWKALTIEEKIVQFDSGMMDTGPAQRLTLKGNYELSIDGEWKRIEGSTNELTGRSN